MSVQPSDEDRDAAHDLQRHVLRSSFNVGASVIAAALATTREAAREAGRRAGLEEAAKLAETYMRGGSREDWTLGTDIAKAIREAGGRSAP